jgi:hypothetical protein
MVQALLAFQKLGVGVYSAVSIFLSVHRETPWPMGIDSLQIHHRKLTFSEFEFITFKGNVNF